MAATIREIAKRLNLSHTTVSRVLNNRNNVFISIETRDRVLTAAREMNYLPNLAARSLRDSRTNMIGVFGSADLRLDSGLIPDIMTGVRRVLHARQLDLFFAFSPSEEVERRGLPAWRFDGAIVLQSPSRTTVRHLLECGQPFIAINESLEGVPCILCDDRAGTRAALDHLSEAGHRRIAYVNAEEWQFEHYSVVERHDAYLEWMRDHDEPAIFGHDDRTGYYDCTRRVKSAVIEQGATAIVAYDHAVAVDVLAAAQRLGLCVPRDFSLITFNDEFPVSRLVPPLTVVAPGSIEMGRLGAELLLNRLQGSEGEIPLATRVPEQLIVRESVAPPIR